MHIGGLATGALISIPLLLASPVTSRPLAVDRAVVVTFDDLPATVAGVEANDVASFEVLTRKLLGAVQKYSVPAVGFVNEDKLFVEGEGRDEADRRLRLLGLWLEAGLELGNHSYSHGDLNRFLSIGSRPTCCEARRLRAL